MKKAFEASQPRSFIFLCSRRLGKSYTLCAIAMERALRKKTKIIYATASFKAAREIIRPLMGQLLESCPASVRPSYRAIENKYVFPNGSEMLLIGLDKTPDAARGQEADVVILDEAGFILNLGYLISSVFTPMLLMTNGRILMATTPPKHGDHDFLTYLSNAEENGTVIVKTIHDCPRITPKMLAEYQEEAGGAHSETWRREYLCQIVRSQEMTVVPEFDEPARDEIVKECPINPHFDRYVAMDLGFVDFTGALFAQYNFLTGQIVIQRELVINRENTSVIALAIKALEHQVWPEVPVYKRVADCNNPQFIHDLSSLHSLPFSPDPRVGTKEQRINRLRLMVSRRELVIDPSCKKLITQLKYCRWKNSERMTFERSEAHGHYDLVDALVILVNNIVRGRNPIPANYDIYTQANIPHRTDASELSKLTKPSFKKFRRPF